MSDDNRCGFCGTINNAHHSAECIDTAGRRYGFEQPQPSESGWISVEDRLPEESSFIIGYGSHVHAWMVQYREGKFRDVEDGDLLTGITHWQPLPAPPPEG